MATWRREPWRSPITITEAWFPMQDPSPRTPGTLCQKRWPIYGQPLVTVVCFAYNHADMIAEALDGILEQETDFPFEVVVHDDASTDGTSEVIRRYHESHPDVIHPILQAMNQYSQGVDVVEIVMRRARGAFIAICDGDDYWCDPRKLQYQVDFLRRNERFSGCCHLPLFERPSSRLAWNARDKSGFRELTTRVLLEENPITPCTVVLRADAFKAVLPPAFSGLPMGDWPRWLLATLDGPMALLYRPMAVYRLHEGGVWSLKPRARQYCGMLDFVSRLDELLPVSFHHAICSSIGWHAAMVFLYDSAYEYDCKVADYIGRVRTAESPAFVHGFVKGHRDFYICGKAGDVVGRVSLEGVLERNWRRLPPSLRGLELDTSRIRWLNSTVSRQLAWLSFQKGAYAAALVSAFDAVTHTPGDPKAWGMFGVASSGPLGRMLVYVLRALLSAFRRSG